MPDFFRTRKWDLVGKRRFWYVFSALTIIGAVYFLINSKVQTGHWLNVGIDFTGGGLITYRVPGAIPPGDQAQATSDVRGIIEGLDIRNFVEIAGPPLGRKNLIIVRTQFPGGTPEAEKQDTVEEQADTILGELEKDPRFKGIRPIARDVVGGIVSRELTKKAALAIALGSIFILLWVGVRYDFKFSVAAISALLHDVIVLLGVFALLQRQVESPFVAAILTVVGYSVHDTIVLFDRIRENLKLRKGATFSETANISLLETMSRSINTVLTVEFTLLALYFFGGATLQDFVLAMLIGVTTGGYSSIFIASQLLTGWKEREARRRALGRPAPAVAAPARRKPQPQAAPAQPQPAPADEAGPPAPAAAATRPDKPPTQPKPKRKPGGKSRKRKKRY